MERGDTKASCTASSSGMQPAVSACVLHFPLCSRKFSLQRDSSGVRCRADRRDTVTFGDGSCRLCSLWDIMQRFHVIVAGLLLRELKELQCGYLQTKLTQGPSAVLSDEGRAALLDIFKRAEQLAEESGLTATTSTVIFSRSYYNETAQVDVSTAVADLRHLEVDFLNDLSKHAFLRVAPATRGYLDNDALFGDVVKRSFPQAAEDLKEAGNCLAADCNTAAVFHLMRVVEWGLRDFCGRLGFRRVVIDKKKNKYAPVEYAQWDKILGQVQGRVDHKVEHIRNRRKKQQAQEFYYPILQDIRAIKDAWRNHVMHTRRQYSDEDALAVLSHVKRLMVALSV
jgi:hypothetical protein